MSRHACLFMAVILANGIWAAWPCRAVAQDDQAAPAAAEPEKADADLDELVPATEGQSYVMWFLRSSGLIGLFILGLSIYFVATVIRLFIDLRPDAAAPPDEVARCQELIEVRDFKGVYSFVRASDSFLCRVFAVGLSELPNGLAEARDTMERVGEAETVDMEKKISMLAVLGTLGPMIGLIGTLKGMIASFSVIAMSDVQLKSSEVAAGISEALLLTFEGVALSVPAIYFFAVFRNRVSSISVSTMLQADHLLRQFAHAARVKAPPVAQPPAAVAVRS